jgi:hypothetical protein
MADDPVNRSVKHKVSPFIAAIGVHGPEAPFTIAYGDKGYLGAIG